jgi:hypothetical protein
MTYKQISPDLRPGLFSECKLHLSQVFFFLIPNIAADRLLIQAHNLPQCAHGRVEYFARCTRSRDDTSGSHPFFIFRDSSTPFTNTWHRYRGIHTMDTPINTVGLSSDFHPPTIPPPPKRRLGSPIRPGLTSGDLLRCN